MILSLIPFINAVFVVDERNYRRLESWAAR